MVGGELCRSAGVPYLRTDNSRGAAKLGLWEPKSAKRKGSCLCLQLRILCYCWGWDSHILKLHITCVVKSIVYKTMRKRTNRWPSPFSNPTEEGICLICSLKTQCQGKIHMTAWISGNLCPPPFKGWVTKPKLMMDCEAVWVSLLVIHHILVIYRWEQWKAIHAGRRPMMSIKRKNCKTEGLIELILNPWWYTTLSTNV